MIMCWAMSTAGDWTDPHDSQMVPGCGLEYVALWIAWTSAAVIYYMVMDELLPGHFRQCLALRYGQCGLYHMIDTILSPLIRVNGVSKNL